MPWKWYDSRLVKIEEQTSSTRRFWLEVPEGESLDYRPGQFVTLDLPIAEKRLQRWRSYSIANPPNGNNRRLELCIVQLEGGRATDYLFNEMTVGSTVRFKGPSGAFTLPGQIDHELVFVCTGTGVAPFRSMLLDLERRNTPHRGIHLIFGCRREEDILYREDFERLLREMPGFRYSVALSREEGPADAAFPVYSGYVHQIYEKEYPAPSDDRRFYLCGWSQMIDEARERLQALGYDKKQVFYELYG